MIRLTSVLQVSAMVVLAAMAGCTPAHVLKTAPVTGKVTCGGKVVTEGYLTFTPVVSSSSDAMTSGKSGYATIQSDGTYTVSTYDEGDGALVGKHQVRIYKPDPEDDEEYRPNNFACGSNVLEVTVEDKDNVIDLDPAKGQATIAIGD